MNGHQEPPVSAAKRLRQLLSDPSHTVVAPGVYDGITARLALAQGFECLYMTGAGTSMSRLGMADLGLATFSEMSANAATLAALDPAVPLLADADTGYGGPLNVARTVRAYARAGVAGLHLEDQVQEKRCGHLAGKRLVARDVYYARLRAACRARDESGSGIVIIARTDARAGRDAEGRGGFDEAVERLRAAAEIGVDALFLEALDSAEECREAIRRLPRLPVLLNMVPGGRTPVISNQEAKEMGFRIVIWPTLGLEAVVPAVTHALKTLKASGKAPADQEMGPTALFKVCGLDDLVAFDQSVGGQAYDTI